MLCSTLYRCVGCGRLYKTEALPCGRRDNNTALPPPFSLSLSQGNDNCYEIKGDTVCLSERAMLYKVVVSYEVLF